MSYVLSEEIDICFTIFHISSTLQFDMMLENELFACAFLFTRIIDSVLDKIDFRTPCRNELRSKTVIPPYI